MKAEAEAIDKANGGKSEEPERELDPDEMRVHTEELEKEIDQMRTENKCTFVNLSEDAKPMDNIKITLTSKSYLTAEIKLHFPAGEKWHVHDKYTEAMVFINRVRRANYEIDHPESIEKHKKLEKELNL